jgi:hypothetical protein
MADPSSPPPTFQGFDAPRQNWFRMPNEWIDMCAEINSLAEIKVVQYIMRHTWGHQEYGIKKRISLDEFMNGRLRKDGGRIDKGTGLSKPSVIAGIRSAVERGFLVEEVDNSDKARVKKFYSLRMHPQTHEEVESDVDEEPEPDQYPQNQGDEGGVKDLNADVKNFYPDVKNLYPRGKESIHRTKKETLERNLKKETDNNNTRADSSDPIDTVVVALFSRGISKRVAEQLASNHSQDLIEEKIEFHDFLVAERPSDIKKPAAWLRKAIEDDYKAPDGFVSAIERHRQAEELERRKQAVLAAQEAQEKAAAQARQSEREQLELRLSSLHEKHNTTPEALDFWGAVKQQLESKSTAPVFALVADSHILQLNGKTALVGVTAEFKLKQLEHPGTRSQIQRTAQQVAKTPIELTFTLLT